MGIPCCMIMNLPYANQFQLLAGTPLFDATAGRPRWK